MKATALLGTAGLAAVAVVVLSPVLRGRPRAQEARLLVPGQPADVVHVLGTTPPVFRVEVPDHATSLHLWTSDANADLAMLVSFAEAPDPEYRTAGVYSPDDWVDEELWIHVTDYYALEPGDWYLTCPVNVLDDGREEGDTVSYRLFCELYTPVRTALRLDEPVTVTVRREQGLLTAFECDVTPPLVREDAALRLEVLSNHADVDVLAGPRAAGETYWGAFALGRSSLGYERVRFRASESGRRFGVLAYALPELDPLPSVELTVLLTRDLAGSPTLVPAPVVPATDADSPLDAALAATVGVFGPIGSGSGVVVSPRGHVLTNAHVVTGRPVGGSEFAPYTVAFDVDHRRPAAPTLGATLLEYDEALDLALLRIDSDLILRPLPENLRFPHLALRPAAEPARIGDPLWCLGFPMTGGSNSFVTVTATRGVLSGFSQELEGLQLKVDADIHSGMSGGACIDLEGRLLGLPSASLSDYNEAGGLGFVTPIENVPSAWWEHLRE